MENTAIKILLELFSKFAGKQADSADLLPASGSSRRYYRIKSGAETIIGACNDDKKENEAFFSFTEHFLKSGLPVPHILISDRTTGSYLLNDLGDTTLFSLLSEKRKNDDFPVEIIPLYKKVLDWLPVFQVKAAKGIDYSKCYPRASFDRQSMMWDLNYFKYYFLKLAKIPFDEQHLEDDFNSLIRLLLDEDQDYFMYRDFQSRNIMIVNDQPWFIDYQGGRKGALQYDAASLLFDGKAAIPPGTRQELLKYYMEVLGNHLKFDHDKFLKAYNGFVLIRIMQAMGAYGFRGYYENKPHFLQSIPYAVKNLEYILNNDLFPIGLNALRDVIEKIAANPSLKGTGAKKGRLKVTIRSFSYKKGIPAGDNENGGGFVFDCRALPNPGRYEAFSSLSGKDKEVIDYLMKESSVDEFLNHVFAIVDQSVKEYISRDFSSLFVDFGCTGGQHRSVYCAEKLAAHLAEKFSISINLQHTQKDNWKR